MAHLAARIAELIDHSTNREELLQAVATEVRNALNAAACSVYLEDEQSGHLLLVATDGVSHGVTELSEPATYLDDGRLYWREKRVAAGFPARDGGGEDADRDSRPERLLGVPLRRDRRVVGAIVLHDVTRQALTDADEAMLLTSSVQVTVALRRFAYAAPSTAVASTQARFIGVAGASGVAIAHAVFPAPWTELKDVVDRAPEDQQAEVERYQGAVASLLAELHTGRERLSDLFPDGLEEVFSVYREIVNDRQFSDAVVQRIRGGQWAPAAVRDAVSSFADVLMSARDDGLKARAEDFRAIGRRLLLHLSDFAWEKQSRRCVLVGTEVNLVRMAEVGIENLAGIVSFEGSTLSHASLLARSLGIPAVVGIGQLARETYDGSLLIVDGYSGRVIANPVPTVLSEYRRLEQEEAALARELKGDEGHPARTLDGLEVPVRVNVSLPADADRSRATAQGVGLYRSEFPFMLRDSLPTESEQVEIYRTIISAFAPEPVVMRTLDVGGDKPLSYLTGGGRNPFLGARGIRISLDHPEVFVSQVRAMLRAAIGFDNLRLLLPMVSAVSEVIEARKLIERARESLAAEGINTSAAPVGVMVEVPSLVFQMDSLAEHVDFFSIGTNDLTQYVMAAARENPEVAALHDHLQPAVLSAIRSILEGAHRNGRRVSVCGELASDPLGVVPLLGMGVDELSVAPSAIGRVKRIIRNISSSEARVLADDVLSRADVGEVRSEIIDLLARIGLGGLVRAGR
ncbi:MAG: phosphoenolpyruvate--protein phosphotransferase [Pseudomonadales bacterium]